MCKKRERSSRCLEERENNCDNFCRELMNTGELSCFSITLQRGLWVKYSDATYISRYVHSKASFESYIERWWSQNDTQCPMLTVIHLKQTGMKCLMTTDCNFLRSCKIITNLTLQHGFTVINLGMSPAIYVDCTNMTPIKS